MTDKKLQAVSGLQLWRWRNQSMADALMCEISPGEVDWLLLEVAGLDRLALRLESFKEWPEIEMALPLEDLDQLWQRRLNERLPVQYITGVTYWRKFKIAVSNAVLIPRPETEYLIDLAVAAATKKGAASFLSSGHWADLGTGSGAIALGLADALPKATIHAVDCSPEALEIARSNARNLGFDNQIKFYQGCWWEPVKHLKHQFSGMVSNPPYIPTSTVPILQPEVVKHEPHLALDGGSDGLDYIRQLIEISPHYLCPGGVWLIEMMAGQAETVGELLQKQGSYYDIQIHADLAGIERFAVAYVDGELLNNF
ncbi:MAG: peptide chain release factor N(5)-glutamine methyltransferase [Nostoc sp. RI_552]|nr:peptide chain release factor N(5)-glutamine methyltransferase [Nostoc sp. RI_552]